MKESILILAVALLCVRCTPDEDTYYRSTWRVINLTDEKEMTMVPTPTGDFHTIGYDRGIEWEYYLQEYNREHRFETMLDCWKGWADQNISFEMLSADGTSLVKWNYSDRNGPGRQFFNPSSWKHSLEGDGEYYVRNTWTFEIRREDINRQ
jgi:hypothetical protein